MIHKLVTLAAALMIATTAGAFAQGASEKAPGHQSDDIKKDAMPGQSGYAPGHQSGDKAKDDMPGQSGYAPGHNKETTGSGNQGNQGIGKGLDKK